MSQNLSLTPNEQRQMSNAIRLALQNFRYFAREQMWDAQRSERLCEFAGVLCTFTENHEGVMVQEKLWLTEVTCDGKTVQGQVRSAPATLKQVQEGGWYAVPFNEIDDWVYAIHGKVYGGYTMNLQRSWLSEHERNRFDQSWGLDFGDHRIVEIYPSLKVEEPEEEGDEAEPAKFFGVTIKPKSKKKKVAQDDLSHINQRLDHPMAIQMYDGFKAFYELHPEVINAVNEKGWTLLHINALAGNRHIVKLLLSLGADPHILSSGGRTARDMAKSLGWPEIVTTLSAAERGQLVAPTPGSTL